MASEVIASYAGLPSTSEETVVLAPLMPSEVLNFKPTHARIYSPFQSNSSPFPVGACYLRTGNATEQKKGLSTMNLSLQTVINQTQHSLHP